MSETNEKLKAEFLKCKSDPWYFISKYIKIIHPKFGLVPFELYPFQRRILKALQNNRFNILRKFRQAGCTTLASAYTLWLITFHSHKTVAIISKGDQEATEVLERIKIMHDELPRFLKAPIVEDNKHTLKLKTNSVVKSRSSGKQAGRSLSCSFLIIDEAAFIDNIDSIWGAVFPTLSTGGAAFVLSTVNGVGNWFHTMYEQARKQESSFNEIFIHWKEHPEYFRNPGYEDLYKKMEEKGLNVDTWEKTTKSNIPYKQWLQEYEAEFLGTGSTFIEGSVLERLVNEVDENYQIKYNNRMRIWKEPNLRREYIMGCDVSLGRERDNSAFHIFDRYTGEQVAEFYSNRTPISEFADIVVQEARYYNNAMIIPERNTIGNNLINWVFEKHEYDNIWQDDKRVFGFQITNTNREGLLAELEIAIRSHKIRIKSKRTVEELLTLIINDTGKIQADRYSHDDLAMSLALTVYLLNSLNASDPPEIEKGEYKEQMPAGLLISKSFQGISREDIDWLLS